MDKNARNDVDEAPLFRKAPLPDSVTNWDAEIARRIDEIEAGQVGLVDWKEVLRRLDGPAE